jgi:nucleotide-binding universal stress UspA family protein
VFERILVPLDGSAASEAALPEACAIARASSSTLILAHIVEAHPPRTVHGQPHLAEAVTASAYLEEKAGALRAEGFRVETHVHGGEGSAEGPASPQRVVAETLAAHAAELGFDLAVMAAHGRRGAADWLAASLPFKVAASGCSAVYLARRRQGPAGWSPPARVLIPLDGRADHEAALDQAVVLAKAFGIPVELLAVVPRWASEAPGRASAFSRFSPALHGASLEYAAAESATYLEGVAARLSGSGLAVTWNVERGRPAKRILKRAAAGKALIVLSTHRKLGMDATLEGCVAFAVATAYDGDSLIAPVPSCS